MKVADVTYEGPMRSFRYQCRNGEDFFFKRGRSKSLESLEAVEELDSRTIFNVDWTVHGELLRRTDGTLTNVVQAVREMSYRQKQKLAKSFGIKANQSEEELEEQLEEQVDELQKTAEL